MQHCFTCGENNSYGSKVSAIHSKESTHKDDATFKDVKGGSRFNFQKLAVIIKSKQGNDAVILLNAINNTYDSQCPLACNTAFIYSSATYHYVQPKASLANVTSTNNEEPEHLIKFKSTLTSNADELPNLPTMHPKNKTAQTCLDASVLGHLDHVRRNMKSTSFPNM